MARSEILLTEGSRPQGSKPVGKAPRSGKISRHTQEEQNMSVVPAVARVGKKRGRSKREALSSLFGGFGAKGHVITAHEKPKLTPVCL